MTEPALYPVPPEWKAPREDRCGPHREALAACRTLADPGSFWLDQAKRLDWISGPRSRATVVSGRAIPDTLVRRGKLNVSANWPPWTGT